MNGVYPTYTGGDDIGGIWATSGAAPFDISNSPVAGFPQGFDPGPNSVIKDTEIYTQDATCNGSDDHEDGLFSQGGNYITYEDNYIPTSAK